VSGTGPSGALSPTRRPGRRWIAIGAGAAALVPLLAWGHAALVRSSPAHRASVVRAPDRVVLWFSERLEPAFVSLTVRDAAGVQVDGGDARVATDDPTALSVAVPALGPGAYTVRYRVLSVDGHVVEGTTTFRVRATR
jgi:methionine-rich copper-binding protein CopC